MKYPEFFTPFVISPNIPIRWYGLMYIVGIVVSCLVLNSIKKKGWIKYNDDNNGGVYDMVFYAAER